MSATHAAKARSFDEFLDDLLSLEAALRVVHGYVVHVDDTHQLPNHFGTDLIYQLSSLIGQAAALGQELAELPPAQCPVAVRMVKGGPT